MMGDIMHVGRFHTRDLQRVSHEKSGMNGPLRTISMKRAPTLSSPSPLGRTLPNAVSRRDTKSSANSASSGRLLKILRASSCVIGGPSNVVDEPEALQSVRRDEVDDWGGVGIGGSLPLKRQSSEITCIEGGRGEEKKIHTEGNGDMNVTNKRKVGSVSTLGLDELDESVVSLRRSVGDYFRGRGGRKVWWVT